MKIPVVFWNGGSYKLINFGVFAAFGAMFGYSVGFFYLYSKGLEISQYCWTISFILVFFNIFFAKAYNIFSIGIKPYFGNFRHNFNDTSFYLQGGIIGFILGTFLLYFLLNIPFAILADAVSIGGIIVMAFGRIGCHNYGCCTGKPTCGRIGIVYKDPNAKICRENPQMMNVPLIPIQLISSAINFLIFAVCVFIAFYYPYSGLITITFFIAVNIKRILIQKYRLKEGKNKIPYRSVSFGFIIAIILIIWFFQSTGELFFQPSVSVIPFTPGNYFRFIISDFNVVTSLLFVFVVNFIAYGINGRVVGKHFNLPSDSQQPIHTI
ncbi:MAG TPA: prolipoprotein diacylglyceryl transferase family protein [Bacteroidales bacterium]